MECYRIDESGYTGFDLLNPDQRFQGASAVAISNEDAQYLIRHYFPKLQAPELKYRSLVKRPSYRQPLLELLGAVLSQYKCVTYVCDKRYLLVLMFLDYAVEPFYFERGHDFYKDGQNYSMASLLCTVGSSLFGKQPFEALLASFQHAIKVKSDVSIRELVEAVRCLNWQELPEALGPLAYESPECLSAIATPGVTTDAAMIVLQSLISRMEAMTTGEYRVEHDESKNLLKYNSLLQQYIEHQDDIEFRATEITNTTFPLKLASVSQVDSKMSPAVQIADVMIGSAIEAANGLTGFRTPLLDPEQVMSLYAENQFIHMIPSIDFDAQKRFRQGTQASELMDYFSRNFDGK